jgi:hypothetical protein
MFAKSVVLALLDDDTRELLADVAIEHKVCHPG